MCDVCCVLCVVCCVLCALCVHPCLCVFVHVKIAGIESSKYKVSKIFLLSICLCDLLCFLFCFLFFFFWGFFFVFVFVLFVFCYSVLFFFFVLFFFLLFTCFLNMHVCRWKSLRNFSHNGARRSVDRPLILILLQRCSHWKYHRTLNLW